MTISADHLSRLLYEVTVQADDLRDEIMRDGCDDCSGMFTILLESIQDDARRLTSELDLLLDKH